MIKTTKGRFEVCGAGTWRSGQAQGTVQNDQGDSKGSERTSRKGNQNAHLQLRAEVNRRLAAARRDSVTGKLDLGR